MYKMEYKIHDTPPPGVTDNMDACYEKAEMDLLRDALKRTHEQRFFMMTRLMKLSIMLKNAKITYKSFPADKK